MTAPLAAGYSQLVPSEPELLPTVSMTPCQISDLCVVVYEFWGLKKERASYQNLDHWSYFLNYFFYKSFSVSKPYPNTLKVEYFLKKSINTSIYRNLIFLIAFFRNYSQIKEAIYSLWFIRGLGKRRGHTVKLMLSQDQPHWPVTCV